MCGIVGYRGAQDAAPLLLDGLHRLEYRGYDSAGIVVRNGDGLRVRKAVGEVTALEDAHDIDRLAGHTGVGHTRWATHGQVTEANAHPHTGCNGRIAIVHNGIIENFEALKAELDDHTFTSETDSEVIAHFLEQQLVDGHSMRDAIEAFTDAAEGAYAFVAIDAHTGALYGCCRGSPLTVGIAADGCFIGSDINAYGDQTRDVVFMEPGEYVVINDDTPTFYTTDGAPVDKAVETVDESTVGSGKQGYDHYMLKEIHEQPDAVNRLQQSLQHSQAATVDRFVELLQRHDKVIFTAAGTSYHASLLGVYYLQKAGIEAQTLIASEFENYERADDDTLLIAVSQSGETRDTLDAITYARDEGATIASIVNMPHSAIQRESTVSLEVQAGKEVCVAATKTFTNTVLTMLHLAIQAGYDGTIGPVADQLRQVIDANEDAVADLAARLHDEDDMYVIGRGVTYPVSREIALKLKEIPYVHAEGMMGGELKHGTLALIEDGTPVFALVPEADSEIMSNVEEIEARGGDVTTISPVNGRFAIPDDTDAYPLYATTIGFLLAYYLGVERGCPIDKPRNLAKTVTVR